MRMIILLVCEVVSAVQLVMAAWTGHVAHPVALTVSGVCTLLAWSANLLHARHEGGHSDG